MKEQIQKRGSGQADGQAAELRQKLQDAQEELDSTRKDLAAAEKQAAEAERALHRSACLLHPGTHVTNRAVTHCCALPGEHACSSPCPDLQSLLQQGKQGCIDKTASSTAW